MAGLGAALGSGLLIGIERGWRLRDEVDGSRVAGLRTFALLGGLGGVIGLLTTLFHPLVPAILLAALATGLTIAHAKAIHGPTDVSATMLVAALIAVSLGMMATSGYPTLAIACAAITTLILSLRSELHGFLGKLGETDVKALARFAIIAAAILPFLPDQAMGPFNAWNPQKLWLVVVFVTGLSFLGYAANRIVDARYGTLATAAIGGIYSSTAVTVALSHKFHFPEEDRHALSAGVALASTVMLLRTLILTAVVAGYAFVPLLRIVGPAVAIAALLALLLFLRSPTGRAQDGVVTRNPIALIPALGFLALVAALAVGARWAELHFGNQGTALLLLIIGTVDVDAATVTLGGMPRGSITPEMAGLVLSGPLPANTLLKAAIVTVTAGWKKGRLAIATLLITGTAIAAMVALKIWA